MLRNLMPHQQDALYYAYQHSAIALFMEMRLGKTLAAIRWAQHQAHPSLPSRTLIVAPLAVLPTWYDELILEKVPPQKIIYITGPRERRINCAASPYHSFFLINYESLRATPEISFQPWDCIILDESTKIRNPKAQITKLLLNRFQHVPAKAILSGLPAPESPLDYFTQFRFLYPTFMNCFNYWQFRKRYFYQVVYDWQPRPSTITKIKEEVHRLAFVRTRKQVSIGSKKIYETRYVPMNTTQRRLYRQIMKDFSCDTPTETILTKWVPVKFVWMARIAGGFDPKENLISDAKADEVLSLLTGELKGEKVVIWCRFNAEIEYLHSYLTAKGVFGYTITGDDSISCRQGCIKTWKTDPIYSYLVVQIKCGKFGVDWSEASTAIYYSNSYEMEDRAQSEDRIVHPAKTEPLLYIDLVTLESIDMDVITTLKQKYVTSRIFMTELVKNWKERIQACKFR